MSLLYDANGDRIDLPSFAPPVEQTIIIAWQSSSDTLRQTLLNHSGADWQVAWRANNPTKEVEYYHEGVGYGVAVADVRNYAAYGLNKWLYSVCRSGSGGCSYWLGDDTTTPAAPSAYISNLTVATPATGAGTTRIGLDNGGIRFNSGPIGFYGIWDVVMSDAEVGNFWAAPSPSFLSANLVVYGRPGSNDIVNVPDDSGNGRTGTITALSSADHLPARIFPSKRLAALGVG